MKKPELLLPAKDLDTLKIAFIYGADAVYLGADSFSLRKNAKNFSFDDIKEGIEFAHNLNKKVYIAANIIARNEDIKLAKEFFLKLKELKPDGVLVADLGLLNVLKQNFPECNIHISTQAGNLNYETVKFYYSLGVRRVVLERLLTIEEIKEIRNKIPDDMELEAFVHGAMCISYSGRCLLSAVLTQRNANLGDCTHPCRWKYSLKEEKRDDEYFPIEEDDKGTYVMNSKDLCMIDKLDDLKNCGINSFKIEGRMKNILYVATMASAYKKAIEAIEDKDNYDSIKDFLIKRVSETTHRPYSYGYYYGDTKNDGLVYDDSSYETNYIYLGFVTEIKDGFAIIRQKNKFVMGENIELLKKNGDNIKTKVLEIHDEYGNQINEAPHPKQVLFVKLDCEFEVFDVLRKKSD